MVALAPLRSGVERETRRRFVRSQRSQNWPWTRGLISKIALPWAVKERPCRTKLPRQDWGAKPTRRGGERAVQPLLDSRNERSVFWLRRCMTTLTGRTVEEGFATESQRKRREGN